VKVVLWDVPERGTGVSIGEPETDLVQVELQMLRRQLVECAAGGASRTGSGSSGLTT
jgi:hypothetical protein